MSIRVSLTKLFEWYDATKDRPVNYLQYLDSLAVLLKCRKPEYITCDWEGGT